MKLSNLKTALVSVLLSASLGATELSNSLPSHASFDYSGWQQWPTVGTSELDVMFFDIYTSELKTPDGRYIQNQDITPHPVALSILYERNISKKNLIKETRNQWLHLGYSETEFADWEQSLQTIFPDVLEGDRLVYITDGDSGSFLYIRNDGSTEQRGEVTQEAFNDAFLAIWLSPNTEYPKHRRQLIGMNQ
jgi:hypothetical protein